MPKISMLFRESWGRYKPLWKRLAVITAAFYAITVLIEALMVVLGVGGVGLFGLSGAFSGSDAFSWKGTLGVAVSAAIILIFVELLISSWLQATLITAIHDNNPSQPFAEVARKGRLVTNRVFGASLLSIFFILLGSLLIIPGIYLAIAFAFVAYVTTLEGLGTSAALKRSRELVRGRWWAVCGALFVLGLALGITTLVLEGVGKQIGGTSLQTLISIAVGIIATPFGAIYTYLLYKHLSGK